MSRKKFLLFIFLILSAFSSVSLSEAYNSPSLASDDYVKVGKKYFKGKDYDRAIEQFDKALLADPKNEEAILYLRMLGFGMPCPPQSWACADQECGPACEGKSSRTKKERKGDVPATKSKADQERKQQLELEKKVVTDKMKKKTAKKEKEALKRQRAKAAKEEKAFLDKVQAGLKPGDLKEVQRRYKEKYGKKASGTGVKPGITTGPDEGFAVGVEMDESVSGQKDATIPAAEVKAEPKLKAKTKTRTKTKTKKPAAKKGAVTSEKNGSGEFDEQSLYLPDQGKGVPKKGEAVEDDEDLDGPGFAVGVGMSESRYGITDWSPQGTRSPALKKEYKGLDALIAKLQSLEEQKEELDQNKNMARSKKAMAQKRLIADIKETKADIKAAKADITKKENALAKAAASKKSRSAVAAKKKAAKKKKKSVSEDLRKRDEYLEKDMDEGLEGGPAAGPSKKSVPRAEVEVSRTFKEDSEDAGGAGESPLAVRALADELAPLMTKEQKYQLAELRARHARQEREILREFDDEVSQVERKLNKKYGLDGFVEGPAEGSGEGVFAEHEMIEGETGGAAPARTRSSVAGGRGAETSLKAENTALRNKLNDLIEASREDQELIERLQDQEVMGSGEKARLKSQLEKAQTQFKDRRGAIKDVGAKMKDLYARVEELEDELNGRRYDFKDKQLDYEKKIQDILDQFDDLKYEKAKSQEDFLDQLRTLKEALKQKIAELNAAEEKMLFTEYKLKKLQARYDHKNKQFEALQKTLMELENRMSELQGKLQMDDVELSKIEPQNLPPPKTREEAVYQRWIQRHDRLVTKLKEKLLWAHQQMEYYGQYDIKLSEDKMAVLKHEIAELKKQLSSKDPFPGEKGEKKEDYELMEERLKDTQERLNMVEKILKEKESQIKELEDQLNGALSNF